MLFGLAEGALPKSDIFCLFSCVMIAKDKYTFKNIVLKAKNLSEQYQFYVEKLGFRAVINKKDNLVIQCGTSRITFEAWDEECIYHYALNIPENQVKEALKWARKHTEILEYEGEEVVDFPNWNAHSIYFFDPAGNIVELIARHDLHNATNFDFNSDSICEISEVGTPYDDVGSMIELHKKELGFDVYWGNAESFAAIGHQQCLFITVPTKRPWLPTTDILSKIEPLRVILDNGERRVTLLCEGGEYKYTK